MSNVRRRTLRTVTVLSVCALVVASAATAVTARTARSAQPAERLLFLGSSTTGCAGQIQDPGPGSPECYVNLVRAARPAADVTVVGRGGTYVGYGAAWQNWTTYPVPAVDATTVVLQLGVNDWYVPVPPATYRAQLDRLLARVRGANPDARLVWVRSWMPTPTGTYAAQVERLRMWTLHGYVTADALAAAGGRFVDLGTSPQPRRSTLPGDGGWHLNARGHAELATAVLRALDAP